MEICEKLLVVMSEESLLDRYMQIIFKLQVAFSINCWKNSMYVPFIKFSFKYLFLYLKTKYIFFIIWNFLIFLSPLTSNLFKLKILYLLGASKLEIINFGIRETWIEISDYGYTFGKSSLNNSSNQLHIQL